MMIQCVYGHEFHARVYAAQTTLQNTYIHVRPDCPCFADDIAESYPDMNIKVAAFTAIKELYSTLFYLPDQLN